MKTPFYSSRPHSFSRRVLHLEANAFGDAGAAALAPAIGALRNLTELHLGANGLTAGAFAANGALVNALCGIQVRCAFCRDHRQ
jgi:hypothetical protein